jgi:glycosyltransferase involved in cell wall biosynthesis
MIRPVTPRPHPRLDGAPLRLGYLGRLDPTKGIELLIDAAAALPAGGWELQVAGSGSATYEGELRARAAAAPVRFLGFVDPDEFLDGIDVLAVPSLYHEPLGMVVVEAFAHGIPVVGARRGGIAELIDDGRTGTLFEPDAPLALRDALAPFVAEPARAAAMRDACVVRARDFLPERVVAEHRALYEEVLGSSRGGKGAADRAAAGAGRSRSG